MKRLYMVILLAGICLVSAVASGFSIFYNVFYVLVAALLGNLGWAYLNLQGLQITALRRSGRAKVGDFAESDLTIKNFSPLPKLLIEVQDMAELPGQVTGKVFKPPARPNPGVEGQASSKETGLVSAGPGTSLQHRLLWPLPSPTDLPRGRADHCVPRRPGPPHVSPATS